MAIRTSQVTSSGTIEQLRNEFNNLVTDVSSLESGTLNFASIAATSISIILTCMLCLVIYALSFFLVKGIYRSCNCVINYVTKSNDNNSTKDG